jgi:hypothetical protein
MTFPGEWHLHVATRVQLQWYLDRIENDDDVALLDRLDLDEERTILRCESQYTFAKLRVT